jgi:SAM-dependent methyltransferase
MMSGERQVSTDISGIRADHVNRYKWAIDKLPKGSVIDAACGIGYGSWLMAEAGFHVRSVEIDAEAVGYARAYYNHRNVFHQCLDLNKANLSSDPVVAFEIIEHIEAPLPVLKKCNDFLIASVPNESVFPYRNYAFHYRHYTKGEFELLLNEAGYKVESWYGQEGPESEVVENINGRTLIAMAKR